MPLFSLQIGSLLHHNLVDIAPHPLLARLNRFDDGVLCLMEMFRCVLVARVVAAANMPADHTHAQVYPSIAGLQAVFAALRARLYVLNQGHMFALHLRRAAAEQAREEIA